MIDVAQLAVNSNPANVLNQANLASIYREIIPLANNADEWAKQNYEKAIALEPSSPALYTELATVYIAMADRDKQLTQASDQKAATEAKTKLKEDLAKAEETLNKAIELKADYAPAHFQLALVYDRQGRLKDAIAKMEQVARANSQDVGVAFQLGLLYLRNNDDDKAQTAFEWAVKLAPSYANARWFLATVYENKGLKSKAIEQISKVLELNPGNKNVEQRLDSLKQNGTSQPPAIPQPVEENKPSGAVSLPQSGQR